MCTVVISRNKFPEDVLLLKYPGTSSLLVYPTTYQWFSYIPGIFSTETLFIINSITRVLLTGRDIAKFHFQVEKKTPAENFHVGENRGRL